MSVAINWLAALLFLSINYVATWVAWWPMRRNDWREWKINGTPVDWKKERPWMWPPIFVNPYIWMIVQMFGGLGASFVLAADVDVGQYHVCLWFYSMSFLVFQISIYPALWSQVTWIVVVWIVSNALAWVAAILAFTVNIPGGVILTIYAGVVAIIWIFNATGLLIRLWFTHPKDTFLYRHWKPFPVFEFFRNWLYYPNEILSAEVGAERIANGGVRQRVGRAAPRANVVPIGE